MSCMRINELCKGYSFMDIFVTNNKNVKYLLDKIRISHSRGNANQNQNQLEI